MTRIGIDARLNAYRGGGIAEYTRQLLRALPDVDPTNEYIVLLSKRDSSTLTFGSNFRRFNVLTPPHHRLERLALSAEIAPLRLDVLHSPDFIPPRFAPRKVITVHDLNFLVAPQFQTPEGQRYYANHIRAAVREAHILAVSETTKNDLMRLLNVPESRITVQPEGVDPVYQPLPPEIVQATKSRLGLPSTYILFVGTFEPRKNIPGLFEAYHALRAMLPDTPPLVLVGRRGWLYEPIFQKAADLKLEPYIKWMENVTFEDLPAVYNGAIMLVTPSFYEGFGLPPLEAMACGTPTVVSNRGALPEVVGTAGLVVDLDQADALSMALHRALTDEAWRTESRRAGLARAALYTWQHTAKIALESYQHNQT